MFDRFTDRAKKVLSLSRQAAMKHEHDFIGPAHILMGIVTEGTGVAASVLKNTNVSLDQIRDNTVAAMPAGTSEGTMGQLPFTPSAKRVLESSLDEASRLGHNYIGTEHLLLGLLCVSESIAANVLTGLGIELEQMRSEVLEFCGKQGDTDAPEQAPLGIPGLRRQALRRMARNAIVMLPAGEPFESLYQHVIVPALEAAGARRVQKSNGENSPDHGVRHQLRDCALLVAVLSGAAPHVMYQIGLCHGRGHEVTLLVEHSTDLPSDLRTLDYLSYDDSDAGHAKLQLQLTALARTAFGDRPPHS
tara:strand:- start:501 stop:1412 length:912 start_codon:yes stop_codon:yes gene_type:complete